MKGKKFSQPGKPNFYKEDTKSEEETGKEKKIREREVGEGDLTPTTAREEPGIMKFQNSGTKGLGGSFSHRAEERAQEGGRNLRVR